MNQNEKGEHWRDGGKIRLLSLNLQVKARILVPTVTFFWYDFSEHPTLSGTWSFALSGANAGPQGGSEFKSKLTRCLIDSQESSGYNSCYSVQLQSYGAS
jgi:hypothetical protein